MNATRSGAPRSAWPSSIRAQDLFPNNLRESPDSQRRSVRDDRQLTWSCPNRSVVRPRPTPNDPKSALNDTVRRIESWTPSLQGVLLIRPVPGVSCDCPSGDSDGEEEWHAAEGENQNSHPPFLNERHEKDDCQHRHESHSTEYAGAAPVQQETQGAALWGSLPRVDSGPPGDA